MNGVICSVSNPNVYYEDTPDGLKEHPRTDEMFRGNPGEDFQCRCSMVAWDPEIDGMYEVKDPEAEAEAKAKAEEEAKRKAEAEAKRKAEEEEKAEAMSVLGGLRFGDIMNSVERRARFMDNLTKDQNLRDSGLTKEIKPLIKDILKRKKKLMDQFNNWQEILNQNAARGNAQSEARNSANLLRLFRAWKTSEPKVLALQERLGDLNEMVDLLILQIKINRYLGYYLTRDTYWYVWVAEQYKEEVKLVLEGKFEKLAAMKKACEVPAPNKQQANPVRDILTRARIRYRQIEKNPVKLSGQQIIDKLAGGDMTLGSCMSLSWAYAAQKAGYNVLDFRGEGSRNIFSKRRNTESLLTLMPDVDVQRFEYETSWEAGREALKNGVKPGKEYILIAGSHAAVVRRGKFGLEYLELQSPLNDNNGWHIFQELDAPVKSSTLTDRFGCNLDQHSYKEKAYLIEVESLGRSDVFIEMLGYINTPEDEQYKGAGGSIR